MAKAKAKDPRPRKLKQRHFEGMEPPSNPKLDVLAEQYVEARNDRMEMLKEEIKRHDLLELAMKDAGLSHYENEQYRIEFSVTQKVKVKRRGDENGDE
jgi:hypothetical protein